MAIGWIRAWGEEFDRLFSGTFHTVNARAEFRRDFRTPLRGSASDSGAELRTLRWGDVVELPQGISNNPFTAVTIGGQDGFVATDHVVEIAWIGRDESSDDPYIATLTQSDGDEYDLLWGDLVQIRRRGNETSQVLARGISGQVATDRLSSTPLLELYFIDVGQGDGVLARTPEGRHLLIDGGLPRSNQMTGKNAADFVDWKFFSDYGHYAITLDGIVASHCDYDHYGGLWDLVRRAPAQDDELECIDLSIGTFFHAGLSRWEERSGGPSPHRDKLGPNDGEFFVRLLGDRTDADAALINGAHDELQGYWKQFIQAIIDRNPGVSVERLGVRNEDLENGGPIPELWDDLEDLRIHVLAPVTVDRQGQPALKDFGDTGKNTNGHSICLRFDYGKARILLTGDLNKKSMDWLIQSYGDLIGRFRCDVVKACHHGSADISYAFLEQLRAGATVISSGDAEGYAHPRPEVVAASAVSGHLEIDREHDRLVTPLVYMTEIERSTSLGEVTHIRYSKLPASGAETDGALFAQPLDDISDKALPTRTDRQAFDREDDQERRKQLEEDAIEREEALLEPLAEAQEASGTAGEYHFRTIRSLFNIEYGARSIRGSRIMTKNHYGLVNVRTDGETILCATMRESGGGWTVHTFKARF
jgi:beta-lactamase superfamily II metal-dependent hydrolase